MVTSGNAHVPVQQSRADRWPPGTAGLGGLLARRLAPSDGIWSVWLGKFSLREMDQPLGLGFQAGTSSSQSDGVICMSLVSRKSVEGGEVPRKGRDYLRPYCSLPVTQRDLQENQRGTFSKGM